MRYTLASALAACVLSACSGSVAPVPMPTNQSPALTSVRFIVVVPGPTADAHPVGPRPHYVSPSTQSIVIALDGAQLLITDVGPGSRTCTPGKAGARTCTAQATAPTGKSVFDVTAFDQPNGAGNVLATGKVPATLSRGVTSQVHLSLAGKPATLAITIAQPYPLAGTAASTKVTVAALDADGNTIIGKYPAPIALTDGDTSGATHLSAKSFTSSSNDATLSYDGAPLDEAAIVAGAPGAQTASASYQPTPTVVNTFFVPVVQKGTKWSGGVGSVCTFGPDGNVWAGAGYAEIIKMRPNGSYTLYPISNVTGVYATGLASGPDGKLWFVANALNISGKGSIAGTLTTGGKLTVYPVPGAGSKGALPVWMTVGPDKRMWSLDASTPAALAITLNGKITRYPLPTGDFPKEIVAGPDRNLWITAGNAVLVLSTSGKVVAVHQLSNPNASPTGITVGPDKNIWFTEYGTNRIGRMTTAGALKEFALPSADGSPLNIIAGPDGNIWFSEFGGGLAVGGKVGYVTLDGSTIRDFPSANPQFSQVHLTDLLFDAQKRLWFMEVGQFGIGDAIGQLIY